VAGGLPISKMPGWACIVMEDGGEALAVSSIQVLPGTEVVAPLVELTHPPAALNQSNVTLQLA
jgi:hypothetical protein